MHFNTTKQQTCLNLVSNAHKMVFQRNDDLFRHICCIRVIYELYFNQIHNDISLLNDSRIYALFLKDLCFLNFVDRTRALYKILILTKLSEI